ncbi:uncharacterized protein LOC131650910 [Vicia villosa]|uniref:uncharacterized protein LOC131650910 n=1 Tax=Vicia villosa TaxID=3911 RepID=UPI00273BEA24|nr:uncharacterized protein LOC131650910 [Vicia villosa]
MPDDSLIWHFEANEEFSVRSSYHLCMKAKTDKSPGPSSAPDPRIWKDIWRASVNPRIRNFLWRVTKNILPTKDNLWRKEIQLERSVKWRYTQHLTNMHHDVPDWLAHNDLLYQNIRKDPIMLAVDSLRSVEEFNRWNPYWCAHKKLVVQTNYLAVNIHVLQVDAGVLPSGNVAYGCIFKDPNDKVILEACKKESLIVDPAVAEMLGIR